MLVLGLRYVALMDMDKLNNPITSTVHTNGRPSETTNSVADFAQSQSRFDQLRNKVPFSADAF